MFVTYTTDEWVGPDALNETCLPEDGYSVDLILCASLRHPDAGPSCVRAACTSLISDQPDTGEDAAIVIGFSAVNDHGTIHLHVDSDDGPVRLVHLLQRFIANNSVAAGDPQPFNLEESPLVFESTDYGNSFAVASGTYAAEYATAMWNNAMMGSYYGEENALDLILSTEWNIVATPSRCPDEDFAAIPWLTDNDKVLWPLFVFIGYGNSEGLIPYVSSLNMTDPDISAPENWPDFCLTDLVDDLFGLSGVDSTWFCDLFGPDGYYSFDSLTNYSVRPSPWVDIEVFNRALNREFPRGQAPRGCFGVVPPPVRLPNDPFQYWLAKGIMTSPADDFELVNTSCIPAPGTNYSDRDDFCPEWQGWVSGDYAVMNCVHAGCAKFVLALSDPNATFTVGAVTLLNSENFPDGGDVRVIHIMKQFMEDNHAEEGLPPQPMNETRVFDTSMVGEVSFRTSATEFARQVAAAKWNLRTFNMSPTINDSEMLADVFHDAIDELVFTPWVNCPDGLALAAIKWTNDFDANVVRTILAADTLLGATDVATNPDYAPETWPDACMEITGLEPFCAAFQQPGGYYDPASMRNFSMVPSPYADLTTLATIFNECSDPVRLMVEWPNHCQCIGQPAPVFPPEPFPDGV